MNRELVKMIKECSKLLKDDSSACTQFKLEQQLIDFRQVLYGSSGENIIEGTNDFLKCQVDILVYKYEAYKYIFWQAIKLFTICSALSKAKCDVNQMDTAFTRDWSTSFQNAHNKITQKLEECREQAGLQNSIRSLFLLSFEDKLASTKVDDIKTGYFNQKGSLVQVSSLIKKEISYATYNAFISSIDNTLKNQFLDPSLKLNIISFQNACLGISNGDIFFNIAEVLKCRVQVLNKEFEKFLDILIHGYQIYAIYSGKLNQDFINPQLSDAIEGSIQRINKTKQSITIKQNELMDKCQVKEPFIQLLDKSYQSACDIREAPAGFGVIDESLRLAISRINNTMVRLKEANSYQNLTNHLMECLKYLKLYLYSIDFNTLSKDCISLKSHWNDPLFIGGSSSGSIINSTMKLLECRVGIAKFVLTNYLQVVQHGMMVSTICAGLTESICDISPDFVLEFDTNYDKTNETVWNEIKNCRPNTIQDELQSIYLLSVENYVEEDLFSRIENSVTSSVKLLGGNYYPPASELVSTIQPMSNYQFFQEIRSDPLRLTNTTLALKVELTNFREVLLEVLISSEKLQCDIQRLADVVKYYLSIYIEGITLYAVYAGRNAACHQEGTFFQIPTLITNVQLTKDKIQERIDDEITKLKNSPKDSKLLYDSIYTSSQFSCSVIGIDFFAALKDINTNLSQMNDANTNIMYSVLYATLEKCLKYLSASQLNNSAVVQPNEDCNSLGNNLDSYYNSLMNSSPQKDLMKFTRAFLQCRYGVVQELLDQYAKLYQGGMKIFVAYKALTKASLSPNFFVGFNQRYGDLQKKAKLELFVCRVYDIVKAYSLSNPRRIADEVHQQLVAELNAKNVFVLVFTNASKGRDYTASGFEELQVDNTVVLMTYSTLGYRKDLLTSPSVRCYLSKSGCMQNVKQKNPLSHAILHQYHHSHFPIHPIVVLSLNANHFWAISSDWNVLWTNCTQYRLRTGILIDNCDRYSPGTGTTYQSSFRLAVWCSLLVIIFNVY